MALLAIPVGAVPGLLVTGRYVDRFGARTLAVVLAGFAAAIAAVGVPDSASVLAVVLLRWGPRAELWRMRLPRSPRYGR